MNTIEKQWVTIQSDCTCTNEDETPSESCYGCYDDSVDNLRYLINDWVKGFSEEFSDVRIDGTLMGWQRESGYAIAPLYRVAEALTIRGDFTITFTLEDGNLTATRSSHDEPTGAHFTFSPVK